MNRDEILSMPAGRKMDALVLASVFGVMVFRDNNGEPYKLGVFQENEPVPNYSGNMSCAWSVVEFLNKDGYAPNLMNDDNGKWYLAFDGTQDIGTVTFVTAFTDVPELWCESAPLAICRAALLTLVSPMTDQLPPDFYTGCSLAVEIGEKQ